MAYSSLAIANEFIERALRDGHTVTPMHLQKFCYMAHGFTLALLDEPLTSDKPEAWDYGPVYPSLYDAIKQYGSGAISELICRNNWASAPHVRGAPIRAALGESETRLIETVWGDYGSFEAFQLSALTHEPDSPWDRTYKPGRKNIIIPDSAIKEYFVGLTTAPA